MTALNSSLEKVCSGCGELKPASGFNKDSIKKDGLSSRCKVCNNRRLKTRRIENREAVYGQVSDWRNKNKEHTSRYMADYHSKNRDKRVLRIRARKLGIGAINELLPGEWEAVVEQCRNTCIVPGCGVSPVTKDHVVPISKGGRHHISNLQPLCSYHNDSKGVKDTDYRNVY